MSSGFESWRAYQRKDGAIVGEDLKTLARLQLTEDRIAETSKVCDELVIKVETQTAMIKDLTKKRNEVQDRFDAAKREWREIEESEKFHLLPVNITPFSYLFRNLPCCFIRR